MNSFVFLIFLYFQVNCLFQYRPDYMKTLPSMIETPQGQSRLEFFTLLSPEDKTQTFRDISGSSHEIYTTRQSPWSNSKVLSREFFSPPDLSKLESYITLNAQVLEEADHTGIEKLMGMIVAISMSSIHPPFFKSNVNFEILLKGGLYEHALQLALSLLQRPRSSIKEHLWLLGLLNILTDQLPIGDLPPLRDDIREGPICWGVLELLYTQKLDVVEMAKRVWNGNHLSESENNSISEAIERVKLIYKIKSCINQADASTSTYTKTFLELHDHILQENDLSEKRKSLDFVTRCLDHATHIDTPEREVLATCWIIKHLQTFHPKTQEVLQPVLLRVKKFNDQYFKESFQMCIAKFLIDGNLDSYPYIGNRFSAFTNLSKVTLQNFQKVLYALKVQENRNNMRGIDDYQVKKTFILESLYTISLFIDGSKEYLDSQLIAKENEQGFTFKSSFSPMIRDGVVELKCKGSHQYHATCFKSMVDNHLSAELDILCPLCRNKIHLPLPYDSFKVWLYLDA